MFQHNNLRDSLFRTTEETLYLMRIEEQNIILI